MNDKKWHENIPAGGVLCKKESGSIVLVEKLKGATVKLLGSFNEMYPEELTPLTAAEIIKFLPESGLNIDVLLRSYDFTVDFDGQVCGLVAGDMGYEDTGIFIDDSCKNAINGEYTDDEWWEFAPWQDMKDAPPDTAVLLIYDEPSWGSYTQELEKAYFDEHTQKWRFWLNDKEISTHENGIIKWLPLPQVSK